MTHTLEISAAKPPLLPITAIARKLNLRESDYDQLGPWFAKLHLDLLRDPARPARGKLILVTATTPTVSGEGKTVTSIGLVEGLEHIGKRAIITSREPSLGPVFGMKGGAAGGGLSQIEPARRSTSISPATSTPSPRRTTSSPPSSTPSSSTATS